MRQAVGALLVVVAASIPLSCWVTDRDLERWESAGSCNDPWYPDKDADGYGGTDRVLGCEAPLGYLSTGGDCDDDDWTIHPTGIELPANGIDEDCDGVDLQVDEGIGLFVTATASASGAGTRGDPTSLESALQRAETTAQDLFLAAGTYSVVGTSLPVSLFGGFNENDWTRDWIANPTRFEGQSGSNTVWIPSTVAHEIVVQGIEFTGPTVAVYVPENAGAWLLDNEFAGQQSQVINIVGSAVVARNKIELGQVRCSSDGSPSFFYRNEITRLGDVALMLQCDCSVIENRVRGETSASLGVSVDLIDNQLENTGIVLGMASGTTGSIVDNQIVQRESSSPIAATRLFGAGPYLVERNLIVGAGDTHAALQVEGEAVIQNNFISGGSHSSATYAIRVTAGVPTRLWVLNNTVHTGEGQAPSASVGVYVPENPGDIDLVMVNNILFSLNPSTLTWGVAVQGYDSRSVHLTLVNNFAAGSSPSLVALAPILDYGQHLTGDAANTCESWSEVCVESHGNVAMTVQMVDPENLDYHLTPTSAGIDAGVDPTSYGAEPTLAVDIDGEPRPTGAGWDVGADEG